jgi:hypothetical protein
MTILSVLKWAGWAYIGIGMLYTASKSPLFMGVTMLMSIIFMIKTQEVNK